MKSFELHSQAEKKLSELNVDKISIKKIQSNTDNINTLLCPINVKYTNPLSKAGRSYFIHASEYYSNRRPGIQTDLPMNLIITSCKDTVLKIYDMSLEPFSLYLFYEELINLMDEIVIYINTQSEGRTYSLKPLSKSQILNCFPEARPARQIYASLEDEQMYEMQHGDVRKPFTTALTGLTEQELFQIGRIVFMNPTSQEIISTITFESFE